MSKANTASQLMRMLFKTKAPRNAFASPKQVQDDLARKLGATDTPPYGNRWIDSPWYPDSLDNDGNPGEIYTSTWDSHLLGQDALGLVPVDTAGGCYWGAIDIDLKDFKPGMEKDDFWLNLLQKQEDFNLSPFRSTSGGVHLYFFSSRRVTTSSIRNVLKDLIGRYGLDPDHEIFPKQETLNEGESGSFINLPLFGAFSEPWVPWDTPGFRRPIVAGSPSDPTSSETLIINHLESAFTQARYHGYTLDRLQHTPPEDALKPSSRRKRTSTGKKKEKAPVAIRGLSADDSKIVSDAVFNASSPDEDHSPQHMKKLEEQSKAATRESLDEIFHRCKNRDLVVDYFSLSRVRQGERHNIILPLMGYVSGVEPRLTGVVESLNSMIGQPFTDGDDTLIGLSRSYEEYRRGHWASRGKEILADSVKWKDRDKRKDSSATKPSNQNEDKSGSSSTASDGDFLATILGDGFYETFGNPVVTKIQQVNQTEEVRVCVRWKPRSNSKHWEQQDSSKDKGYVHTKIIFNSQGELNSYSKSKEAFGVHFGVPITGMSPKTWASELEQLYNIPGMVEVIDGEASTDVTIAATAFTRIVHHMGKSAMPEENFIDRESKFITARKVKGVKYFMFKDLFSAMIEFCSACDGTVMEKTANSVEAFLKGPLKEKRNRDAFKCVLEKKGFENTIVHFDNGTPDGTYGPCRVWRVPVTFFKPYTSVIEAICNKNGDGARSVLGRDATKEGREAIDAIFNTPEPGGVREIDRFTNEPIQPGKHHDAGDIKDNDIYE